MKRRLTSTLLALCVLAQLLPAVTLPALAAESKVEVKLGDYIQLGTYYGEKILWRCVDIDENGPLMLADQILTMKPYDAKTNDNEANRSHSRNYKRETYGSNYWKDSNIRSWLNSDAAAGGVVWDCGNPPKAASVSLNAYDQEAGFLNGFTKEERDAIKTVSQRALVSHPEYKQGIMQGGNPEDLSYYTDINSVVANYDKVYYETVNDNVFLLDVKQLKEVYDNRATLGERYYIGTLTAKAVEQCSKEYTYTAGAEHSTWLRTPVTDCNHDMRYVNSAGYVDRTSPYLGYIGVRPAFYLDTEYYTVTSGDGKKETPYVGTAVGKPEAQEPDVITLDQAATLDVTLGPWYTYSNQDEHYDIPVYVIQKTASDEENMVIVIAAEGYREDEMGSFLASAKSLWESAMDIEPYRSYADHFNVYALCTPSDVTWNDRGVGNYTFFGGYVFSDRMLNMASNPMKNQVLTRFIGPAFIEQVHDAGMSRTLSQNAIIDREKEYSDYYYVYDYISTFVLLTNSSGYLGAGGVNLPYGYNFIMMAATNSESRYTLQHELGHNLFNLGDEYSTGNVDAEGEATSLNMTGNTDPETVKWHQLLGFRKTYTVPYQYGSNSYNSTHKCKMSYLNYGFCEVCKLGAARRMSTMTTGEDGLYVAVPEVTKYTGAYSKAEDFKDATYSGYAAYETDYYSRLISTNSAVTDSLKGQEIELRTIIANLSDTKERKVQLELWVEHADGTTATASGAEVRSTQTYTIPAWTDRANYCGKGVKGYSGYDFDSGLVNATLRYTIPEGADLKSGDKLRFKVLDVTDSAEGVLLADEKTEQQSYADVRITYKLEDGTTLPNTQTTAIPVPVGTVLDWNPPANVNGYTYASRADGLGQTVTTGGLDVSFYYRATGERTAKLGHDITVTSEGGGVAYTEVRAAPEGSTVRVWTAPDQGKVFLGWEVQAGSATVTGGSFTMPDSDVKLKAVFGPSGQTSDLTGTVSIQGTPQVGQTLTANTSAVQGNTGVLTYQWKRGSTNVGTNSGSYTLTEADAGQSITVTVGSTTASNTLTSAAVTVTRAETPEPSASVTIAQPGTLTYDGAAVTAGTSGADLTYTYTGTGSVSVAWYADNNGVKGGQLAAAPKDAGTYWLGVTVGGASDAKAFTIQPAPYTYTRAGSETVTLGAALPAAGSASAVGVAGESVPGSLAWFTDSGFITAASGSFSTVGSTELYYRFTPGSGQSNYVTTPQTGKVTYTVTTLPTQALTFQLGQSVSKTVGDPAFTNRAVNATAGGGAVTYSSGNTAVATVNAATGEVTILAAGSAVITAEAAEVPGSFARTTLSYQLTVSPKQTVPDSGTGGGSTGGGSTGGGSTGGGSTGGGSTGGGSTGGGSTGGSSTGGGSTGGSSTGGSSTGGGSTTTPTTPEVPATPSFGDVPADAWYSKAVNWALEKAITTGTTSETFSPDQACGRAEIVTFLWRAAGCPEPTGTASFGDVPADAWYARAVAWAVEQGITAGTGGSFAPDRPCTRAECMTFLYRASGSPAAQGGEGFPDVASGSYYANAVAWAAASGITTGVDGGLFAPDGVCTRAQIVTFLYRCLGQN